MPGDLVAREPVGQEMRFRLGRDGRSHRLDQPLAFVVVNLPKAILQRDHAIGVHGAFYRPGLNPASCWVASDLENAI